MTVLLLLSWIIDGAVLLRFATILATRANNNPIAPGTFGPLFVLFALLIGSIALTIFGHSARATTFALLLTGLPIALVGGGYGLFLLVMLTVGRNARWN